jgi:hypothetical protein
LPKGRNEAKSPSVPRLTAKDSYEVVPAIQGPGNRLRGGLPRLLRPARPNIWWRKSKGCYFATIDGKQVRLAKTLKESKTKLQKILRGGHQPHSAGGVGATFASLPISSSTTARPKTNRRRTMSTASSFNPSRTTSANVSRTICARPTWTSGAASTRKVGAR